jgi:hypothetical protein
MPSLIETESSPERYRCLSSATFLKVLEKVDNE